MAETRPNPELLLNLEKYIQNARDAQGLTQEKVGEVIGRAGKSVSNIECGRTNPKYDTLYTVIVGGGNTQVGADLPMSDAGDGHGLNQLGAAVV